MVRNGITAFIMLLGGFVIFPLFDRWSMRKRVLKVAAMNHGPSNRTHFMVELLAEGLATESSGVRSVVSWDRVARVGERDGYVELVLDGAGLVIVATRAFADDNECKAFIELAEEYRRAAVPPPVRANGAEAK